MIHSEHLQAIEEELVSRGRRLRFQHSLECAYQQASAAQRNRSSERYLLCYLFANLFCLHPIIASQQRGQRNGLRSGERRVPTGAVLHARDFPAALALVGSRDLVPHQLLFGHRVLALAQAGGVLIADRTGEAPFFRKPALPLAVPLLVPAQEVRLLRRKLTRVVRSRLARRKRLRGHRQHGEDFWAGVTES